MEIGKGKRGNQVKEQLHKSAEEKGKVQEGQKLDSKAENLGKINFLIEIMRLHHKDSET